MDNASACSPEESVSVGADSTKDEDTEDEVLVVEGKEDGLPTHRDERRSKIGTAFKIALFKELQHMVGNPFMEKRRKAKLEAWDALATRLSSVQNVTCQGSFGERTFLVSTPEKLNGVFCSRYFSKERSLRKKQERDNLNGTGIGMGVLQHRDDLKAEEEEFEKALRTISDMKTWAVTFSETRGSKPDSQEDANDVRSGLAEETPPSKKRGREGESKREGAEESEGSKSSDPVINDIDVGEVSGGAREEFGGEGSTDLDRERRKDFFSPSPAQCVRKDSSPSGAVPRDMRVTSDSDIDIADISRGGAKRRAKDEKRQVTFSPGEHGGNLERLSASIGGVGDVRSGPDRSVHDASIMQQLRSFEDRIDHSLSRMSRDIDHYLGRISRDVKMLEDEMVRMRSSISLLQDHVLCLGQDRASDPRR